MKPPQSPSDPSMQNWKAEVLAHGDTEDAFHGALGEIIDGTAPLEFGDIMHTDLRVVRTNGEVQTGHQIMKAEYDDEGRLIRVITYNEQLDVARRMPLERLVEDNLDMAAIQHSVETNEPLPGNVKAAILVDAELERRRAEHGRSGDTEEFGAEDFAKLQAMAREAQASSEANESGQDDDTGDEASADTSTSADDIINEQIAQMENGEGVEHVVPAFGAGEQPTEHEGAAVEREPADEIEVADEAESFMSYEDLVANHAEDIIRGKTLIEGADPDMVGNLVQQVRRIESFYVEAKMETGMAGIGDELMQEVAQLVQNTEALSAAERAVDKAIYDLGNLQESAMALSNYVRYDGSLDGLTRYTGQFIEAATAVGFEASLASSTARRVVSGEALADVRAMYQQTYMKAEEADANVQAEKRKASNADMAQIQDELVAMLEQGGGSIDRLREEVLDSLPGYQAAHNQIAAIHELASNMRVIGSILSFERVGLSQRQDAETAFKVLTNDLEVILGQMRNRGNVRIDAAELATLSSRAEGVQAVLHHIKTAQVRMRSMAQATLS